MMQIWGEFIEQNGRNMSWIDRYDPVKDNYLNIDDSISVEFEYRSVYADFWTELNDHKIAF
ncbi:MAG: hypothetical protein R2827_16185 [Bdellovibrionales bacterium]